MIQDIAKSVAPSSEVIKPGRPARMSWQFLTIGIRLQRSAGMEIATGSVETDQFLWIRELCPGASHG